MRQLFPPPESPESPEDGPESLDSRRLAELYAYPSARPESPQATAQRPWVRANMVCSVDGAASVNGRSGGLSGDTDRRIFGILRSLADVILVGAGTAAAEHYRPAQQASIQPGLRAGRTATPPIAVISGRLNLDPRSGLLTAAPPDARTIVLTSEQAPKQQRAAVSKYADVIVAGTGGVDLKIALTALAERGYQRVLTEGGPHLLAELATGGLLDELCLTVSPLLAGPGPGRILAGDAQLPGGLPVTLGHVLEDEGFLLCRYTVTGRR
jgi:riboflavin biosynthesis pyrimidine reductase